MILRPSYLHNGISYTGKMTSLGSFDITMRTIVPRMPDISVTKMGLKIAHLKIIATSPRSHWVNPCCGANSIFHTNIGGYHVCQYPGSLHCQVISSHPTDSLVQACDIASVPALEIPKSCPKSSTSWRHYDKDTFIVLLALCEGIHQSQMGSPLKRISNTGFDIFIDNRLNKLLNKQLPVIWKTMVLMWCQYNVR